MQIILAPNENVLFTQDTALQVIRSGHLDIFGDGGLREEDFCVVSLNNFTDRIIKKGDVFKVGTHDGKRASILYLFLNHSGHHEASEGVITVVDIDVSVPSIQLRFDFRGVYNYEGDVGDFHAICRVEGRNDARYEEIKKRLPKDHAD